MERIFRTKYPFFLYLFPTKIYAMKISIIGGGNMGGAIALGLLKANAISPQNLTVIDTREESVAYLRQSSPELNVAVKNYDSLSEANIIIVSVKPWLVESILKEHKDKLSDPSQIIVSIAAGISLAQLEEWTYEKKTIFRVIPNTAIALQQSMTFVASSNANEDQNNVVLNLFSGLGKAMMIEEKMVSAVTSLSSCGIAFAFRYIRAAMEGGIEMGLYPTQARDIITQTLRGAIELLETNDSHPEAEIDKVTTPGGITIKGLNEMEHAGFTSAVIRGLKASNIK